jgi:hypothetical protein
MRGGLGLRKGEGELGPGKDVRALSSSSTIHATSDIIDMGYYSFGRLLAG